MYRLGERVRLDLPERFAGAVVEVDTVVSAFIAGRAVSLVSRFAAAEGEDEGKALAALYALVAAEARPSWDLCDHKGPISPDAGGFLRLPTELGMGIVEAWLDTMHPVIEQDPDAAAGPDGGGLTPGPSDAELAAARRRARRR